MIFNLIWTVVDLVNRLKSCSVKNWQIATYQANLRNPDQSVLGQFMWVLKPPKLLYTKVDEIEESPAEYRKGNLLLNIQLVLLNLSELFHLSEKDDKFNVIEHQVQYLIDS